MTRRIVAAVLCAAVMLGVALGAFTQATTGLVFILDCSGSMAGSKIEDAKSHLLDVLPRVLDGALETGLCVFGSTHPQCVAVMVVAMGSSVNSTHQAGIRAAVQGLEANNDTPIAVALDLAEDKLRTYATRRILLITDGEETCDGDAVAVAQRLARSGHDISIYGVGYGISAEGRALLRTITSETNGEYYEGTTPSELKSALANAVTAALSNLQGWVTVQNSSDQPVWVYASNEFRSTIHPGQSLRLSSFPGALGITAVPYQNPVLGTWSQTVTVIAGSTVEAQIRFSGP